jgi:hypothetical protein
MFKIQRSASDRVLLLLSGRIEAEDVAELQRLLRLEASGQPIALDLQEVTIIDRDAMRFLARCGQEGIQLENCPAYVREWIEAEERRNNRQKAERSEGEAHEG